MATEYQIGLVGPLDRRRTQFEAMLAARAAELGIAPDTIAIVEEADLPRRDRKKPLVAIFFGYSGAKESQHPILRDLIEDSVVIVPLVEDLTRASSFIPANLKHINCLQSSASAPNEDRLVSLVLENFRLLRAERRLFISYRRLESQGIAIQLYEKLDELGFDVSLDTRGVPPAGDFQSVLWHRMADSDVVVLLDTPGFRESRWTVEELARANATSVQILHVLWPGVDPDANSAFSRFYSLDANAFATTDRIGPTAKLSPAALQSIGDAAEELRARAMAARFRYLVDNFCDRATDLDQSADVQSSRFISLELKNSRQIAVVPAIGVPNAARYQEIEQAISSSGRPFEKVWLLYDERGIIQGWLDHVDWLNKHLPVTAVRVSQCEKQIAAEAAC